MYETSELTATQLAIIAATRKSAWWLFEIVENLTTHYWSDFSSKTFGGHTYTFKVCDFSPIDMRQNGSEYGLIAPNEVTIRLTNKGNTLTPADYEGAAVTIRLVLSADIGNPTPDEAEIRSWGFECIRAENINQELVLYCRGWLDKYLLGDYPNTPLIEDEFPSDDSKKEKSNLCIPKIWGTAYIPLLSVYKTDARYYLLGPDSGTYTVTEVRSPKEWGPKTTWSSPTVNQSTKAGRSATNYRVGQIIIADSDNDTVLDANGLFPKGGVFLPMGVKYSNSSTVSTTNPADIIYAILLDMGVPSARIDATAYAAAAAVYTGWGLTWGGGLWYKRNRRELLAELLCQAHMSIIVRDTLIFRVKSKTSALTLDETDILLDDSDNDTYTTRRLFTDDQKDSCYVSFQPDGPDDQRFKIVVPAKVLTVYPSSETYEMGFVHDSQHAQKLGTLACQRVYLQHSEISFRTGWLDALRMEVDDVATVSPTNYNGPVNLLITRMRINPGGWVDFRALRFKYALDDWADLAPGAITFAADDSTNTYQVVTSGPDGGTLNVLPGKLRIGTGGATDIIFDPATGTIKTAENPASTGGLLINNTSLTGYNTSGAVRFQAVYSGVNQGDVIVGDYSGGHGIFWDQSAGTCNIKGAITISGGSGIGNLSDAGALAVLDDADWTSDVSNRPTELTDGRITTALNASGVVVSKVVPAMAAAPAGAGLHLGSDYLGYYSGSAWTVYINNSGQFKFGKDANNYLAYNGSTFSIVTNSSGGIQVNGGGDIKLTGGDSSRGILILNGSSYNTHVYTNSAGTTSWIVPDANNVVDLNIGYSGIQFKNITINGYGQAVFESGSQALGQARLELFGTSNGWCRFLLYESSSLYGFYTFETDKFYPTSFSDPDPVYPDCGTEGWHWGDGWANTWNDLADFYHLDRRQAGDKVVPVDDIEVIRAIKPSGVFDPKTGMELIDDNTLPEWLLSKNKAGEIARDKQGRPYLALKAMISICLGAIRQQADKIDELEAIVEKLK